MTDGQARREYERTHWGEKGRDRVTLSRASNPAHGALTELGQLVSVVYLTKKGGDRELVEYEHEFEKEKPRLAYNAGGLVVVGGTYKIREGGIDG